MNILFKFNSTKLKYDKIQLRSFALYFEKKITVHLVCSVEISD